MPSTSASGRRLRSPRAPPRGARRPCSRPRRRSPGAAGAGHPAAPLADAAAAAGPGAASQVEEAHRRRWLTEFVRGRSYAEKGAIVTQHCPVIVDVVATTYTNPAEEDQATRSSHEVPGNACGQSDLGRQRALCAKTTETGLLDRPCSIAGYTVKGSTATKRYLVIGDIAVTFSTKPAEEVVTKYLVYHLFEANSAAVAEDNSLEVRMRARYEPAKGAQTSRSLYEVSPVSFGGFACYLRRLVSGGTSEHDQLKTFRIDVPADSCSVIRAGGAPSAGGAACGAEASSSSSSSSSSEPEPAV